MSRLIEGRLSRSQVAEIAAATVLLSIAVTGVIFVPDLVSGWAFAMPGTTDTALSPTFFPRLILTLFGLAALNMAVTAVLRTNVLPLFEMGRSDWGRMGCVTILVLAYLVGLHLLGFLVASAIFVIAVNALLGNRNYLVIALVSVLAPCVIGIAFRFGLNVILPHGLLGVGF